MGSNKARYIDKAIFYRIDLKNSTNVETLIKKLQELIFEMQEYLTFK